MKLSVKALSLTFGILWGLSVFIMTWWILIFEGSYTESTFIGLIYRGYSVTATGSFIGLAWGLVDGAIAGALVAWVYNLFVGGAKKSESAQ